MEALSLDSHTATDCRVAAFLTSVINILFAKTICKLMMWLWSISLNVCNNTCIMCTRLHRGAFSLLSCSLTSCVMAGGYRQSVETVVFSSFHFIPLLPVCVLCCWCSGHDAFPLFLVLDWKKNTSLMKKHPLRPLYMSVYKSQPSLHFYYKSSL